LIDWHGQVEVGGLTTVSKPLNRLQAAGNVRIHELMFGDESGWGMSYGVNHPGVEVNRDTADADNQPLFSGHELIPQGSRTTIRPQRFQRFTPSFGLSGHSSVDQLFLSTDRDLRAPE
jgi:hypothetical protein